MLMLVRTQPEAWLLWATDADIVVLHCDWTPSQRLVSRLLRFEHGVFNTPDLVV